MGIEHAHTSEADRRSGPDPMGPECAVNPEFPAIIAMETGVAIADRA